MLGWGGTLLEEGKSLVPLIWQALVIDINGTPVGMQGASRIRKALCNLMSLRSLRIFLGG
jgi:hypothetical protein